jgi:hypothetical protein
MTLFRWQDWPQHTRTPSTAGQELAAHRVAKTKALVKARAAELRAGMPGRAWRVEL